MVIRRSIRGIAFGLMMMGVVWIVMAATPTFINVTNPAADPAPVDTNYLNVTVDTDATGLVLLNWNGTNISMDGASPFYKNMTPLTNGVYTYRIYANDTTPDNWTAFPLIGSPPRTVNVNVAGAAPSLGSPQPVPPVSSFVNVTQIFNVTVDQDANVSWKINGGAEVQNLSVLAGARSEYSNGSAGVGNYTITATAINSNGPSSPQTWAWEVMAPAGLGISGLTATRGSTWINWTWTITGSNFNYTIVKINGTFQSNTIDNFFNYSGIKGTQYTITLQTVDTFGAMGSPVSNTSYTLNTPTGTNVSVPVTSGLNVIFSQVTSEGNTSVTVYPTRQPAWPDHNSSFTNVGNYYDIATDAGTGGSDITVELGYDQTGINESTVMLYHLSGTWQDVTTFLDTGSNKVLGNVTVLSPFVAAVPPKPIFTLKDPATPLETIGAASQKFRVTIDQTTNVTWSISPGSSTDIGQVLATVETNFTYTPPSAGNYTVSVTATNMSTGSSATTSWTWTVRSKTYAFGNRVWDGSKGMSTTYTWNPMSFYGFYYDVDSDVGNESLTINLDSSTNRNVGKFKLTYSTKPENVSFRYKPWGGYDVIGFMADKYFAGYTAATSTEITDGKTVSTLSYSQLHKILRDDNNQTAVYVGSTLTLSEGYVLKVNDVGAGRVVMLSLMKDGGVVDTGFVETGKTYRFIKKVGSVNELPVLAVHVESVFQGSEASAAFIKGIFQISESYTAVNSNNKYGIMEILDASVNGITMDNKDSIILSPGSTIDVMGDLKFIVADSSDVLRFALMVERTGTYEVRGTILPANENSTEWDPMNFEGFYYNLNEDVGTEKLSLLNRDTLTIGKENLVYSTSPKPVSHKFSGLGKYNVIGFMAEKYFAGYDGEIKTLNYNQLHKVLTDDDAQHIIYAGSTLTLNEGYVLKIKDVNMGAGDAEVWLSLLKDGVEVDSDFKRKGEVYVYSPKVGAISELPIIKVRIDNIFRGTEATAAFVKGMFQISESYTRINTGADYGIMEISTVNETAIEMKNPNALTMSPGNTVDVMGNIKFRVADSTEARLYPYIMADGALAANQLVINVPGSPMVRDTITINVTAGSGASIDNAEVSFDGKVIGNTNSTGQLDYMLISSGQHTITATKFGYEKATKTISVSEFRDITLKFEIPQYLDQGIPVAIKVVSNGTAIAGANITFNGAGIGQTDSSGILSYTFDVSGTHNLGASKTGYISVLREITVRAPFTEFKALDLNFTPNVVFRNQKFLVWANVTNVGTKNGTLPVGLLINDTVVENKNVTLAPGVVQQVNFTPKVDLSPGNYTIEILGQKKTMELKEEPLNLLFVGGIVTVLGAVVIYLSTTLKGKETLDLLTKKFNELIASAQKK